jgi:hypothetical protein
MGSPAHLLRKPPTGEEAFLGEKWGESVMREDLDDFLPDIEALDALYSKHLPVEWDEMAV